MRSVTVRVPATSANLGPGFDSLGLALGLHNTVEATATASGLSIDVVGEGADRLPAGADNLVHQAAIRLFAAVGRRPPGLRLSLSNQIPVCSGLGSSAAAIVGGLLAANALVDGGLDRPALLALASELEGHGDNVAPALWGGVTLLTAGAARETGSPGRADEPHLTVTHLPAPGWQVVVALPVVELPTRRARAVLPDLVPRQDAVFNLSHAALLVLALHTGDLGLLGRAMADRLHQPYRLPLVPGLALALDAAYGAGAAGVALSGAGPGLIAFAAAGHDAIGAAMSRSLAAAGLGCRTWILPLENAGARVEITGRPGANS